MTEIWKKIKEFPAYDVSNFGNVRSRYIRGLRGAIGTKTTMLKLSMCGVGYPIVHLYNALDKTRKTVMIHRLVGEYFCKKNGSAQINHIDGNKLNNHYTNLEYCTQSENMKHAYRTGLSKKPPMKRKLNDAQVFEIFSSPIPNGDLAKKYGVDRSCICNIKNGKNYAWLTNKHA